MTLGYIGLGKMGHNMVSRLVRKHHEVFAFDPDEPARERAKDMGAKVFSSAGELVKSLPEPRAVWIMVPHAAVDGVISEILPHLGEGDTVIDGGNSFYKDSMRRSERLLRNSINFMDIGVSGGPSGALEGACLMVGGSFDNYKKFSDLFKDLSQENGYAYAGKNGAGHFVKMIHNGIEYGMMQSLAEGFSLMKNSEFDLNFSSRKIL